MQETIIATIDVTKIDRNKLFKGKKGTYLNLALIPTPGSQFGNDYMVVQNLDKEEREAGQRGEILGNAKLSKNIQPQTAGIHEPADIAF